MKIKHCSVSTVFFLVFFGQGAGLAQIAVDQRWDNRNIERDLRVLPVDTVRPHAEAAILHGEHDALFQPFRESFFNRKHSDNWLSAAVTNRSDTLLELYLGTSRFEYLDLWIRIDSQLTGPLRSGQNVREKDKPVPIAGLSFFQFVLPPGATAQLYLRGVNNNRPLTPQQTIPVSLMSRNHFRSFYERPGIMTYMFLGAAFIMALYNLLLFWLTRMRAYLIYTAYVVSVTMFDLALVPQFCLPLYGHMDLNAPWISYIGCLAVSCYILVGREILEIPRHFPKINKILMGVLWVYALSCILVYWEAARPATALLNFANVLVSYPILFALGLIMTWRGHPPGTYFFIASSIYIVFGIAMVLQVLGVLPPVMLGMTSTTIFQIGIAAEMALFSLGLGARIVEMRKKMAEEALEKERILREREEEKKVALEEQNRVLEEKVRDRTRLVVSQKEALEVSLQKLEEEKEKSERLLLNILPEEVAAELKNSGKTKPRAYESATVLFTDFVDFSKTAHALSAQQLVDELAFYFYHFDEITHREGLEKIKTIGDAYMCAGGLPLPNDTHSVDAVAAAVAMLAFMKQVKKGAYGKKHVHFDVRIGIHTGPLVAGVVGERKFAYDVWGDTVNIAARLEAMSVPGRINISETTYQQVKGRFPCEYRGKLDAKNVGEVDMYYVVV